MARAVAALTVRHWATRAETILIEVMCDSEEPAMFDEAEAEIVMYV